MPPLRKAGLMALAFFALTFAGALTAKADELNFVAPTAANGTGFGTVLTLLTLHNTTSPEIGSVSWNGTTTVTTGDATNQSQTYTIQQLINAGVTANTFGVVYNVNETGPTPNPTTLNGFSLDVYNSAGVLQGSISLSAQALAQNPYQMFEQGVGGSGYLFTVAETGGVFDLDSVFALHPDWVIGASGSISQNDNGPETFYIVNTANPVPEPTTMLLLGTGLAGIAARVRRRRKMAKA